MKNIMAKNRLEPCKYNLESKKEKPRFLFFVKPNTANHDYYLYTDFEKAMGKARILSLAEFPLSVVYEPCVDKDGEWHLQETYLYMSGICEMIEHPKMKLHAKFYTEAGKWLNSEEQLN